MVEHVVDRSLDERWGCGGTYSWSIVTRKICISQICVVGWS